MTAISPEKEGEKREIDDAKAVRVARVGWESVAGLKEGTCGWRERVGRSNS